MKMSLAEQALEKLKSHIDKKAQQPNPSAPLNDIRQELLQSCLKQAQQKTGTFTLTAPTGSGKTLSMLSFALQHALENSLNGSLWSCLISASLNKQPKFIVIFLLILTTTLF